MRAPFVEACVLAALAALALAAPSSLAAQDHAGHGVPTMAAPPAAPPETPQVLDHCALGHLPPERCAPETLETQPQPPAPPPPMDHCAMGHLPPEQCPPRGNDAAAGAAPESAVPPRALAGPRHAADAVWGAAAMEPSRRQLARENGGMRTGMVMLERLEARIAADGGEDGYLWDGQAFFGGDINRLVVKTEGEGAFGGSVEDAEIQALFSRAIGPFFDLQAGVRADIEPDARAHLVLGVQGLAPYMLHVDGALFLSDQADLTARVEAEYDQRLTQRLILQPRIEAELAAQDIPARAIGAGLAKLEAGLRLRYEVVPEFAPYAGLEYEAKLGETADLARAAGEDPDGLRLVLGLRAWF